MCRWPLPSRLARAVLMAGLLLCTAVQADVATVEAVKAAYLQKFPLFAEWPPGSFADATSPLVVGVVGSDEVFRELSRQAVGRTVAGRPLLLKRLLRADPSDPPHLLYLGPDARPAPAALEALLSRHVLTVRDVAAGPPTGAVVNFKIVDSRVRFEVSLDAAQKAGIRLSSRLLQVADRVQGTPP